MEPISRKTLDQLVKESDDLEQKWPAVVSLPVDSELRRRQVDELRAMLEDWAAQARYIPTGSPERQILRSIFHQWSDRLYRCEQARGERLELVAFDPEAGVVLDVPCPYPGLLPYAGTAHGRLLGRDELARDAIAHLEAPGNRILIVIGSSGSGKSSLALAGVVPELERRHAGQWLFAPRFTPGSRPLVAMAAAIARAAGRGDDEAELAGRLAGAPNDAHATVSAFCGPQALFLLVDQLEELLTLCEDAAEQAMFAVVLAALCDPSAASGAFECRALLTSRTDYWTRFENLATVQPLYNRLYNGKNLLHMTAMGYAGVRQAIQEPADAVRLRFVPADLVDRLANETAGLTNGLPLLQFALQLLWERRPRKAGRPLDLITEAMVKALPDVQRALGTVAKGLYARFTPTQRELCIRLMQELVVLDDSFDEPLRRRRKEADLLRVLHAHFPDTDDSRAVLDAFVSAHLLLRFGEGAEATLEVAHEALLRHWDDIRDVLASAEVKERLHLIKETGRQADEWNRRGRIDEYLVLPQGRLVDAQEFVAQGWIEAATPRSYVEACQKRQRALLRQAQEAERARESANAAMLANARLRERMFLSGLTLALLVLGTFGGLYWTSSKRAFSQLTAVRAERELQRDPDLSLRLAAQTRLSDEPETSASAERILRAALRGNSILRRVTAFGGAHITATALSPNGKYLITGDSAGGVSLWQTQGGARYPWLEKKQVAWFEHAGSVNAVAFSLDGKAFASGGADGRVVVRMVAESGEIKPGFVKGAHLGPISSIAFSRGNSLLLATAGERDGLIRLWDIQNGTEARPPLQGHFGGVRAVAFGRDMKQLVSAGFDSRVVHWDASTGKLLYSQSIPNVADIDLSEDGRRLVVAGDDVTIWDLERRARLLRVTGHSDAVLRARMSTDGNYVVTCSYDGTVRVWRVPQDGDADQTTARETARFSSRPGVRTFNFLAVDAAASVIAAVSINSDGAPSDATVWSRITGGELAAWSVDAVPIDTLAYTPDGLNLLAASDTGYATRWGAAGQPVTTLPKGLDPQQAATGLTRASDGTVAVGNGADVLVWRNGIDKEPVRLKGLSGRVLRVAISAKGHRVAGFADDRRTVILWDVQTGQPIQQIPSSSERALGGVMSIGLSGSGDLLALGYLDGWIRTLAAGGQSVSDLGEESLHSGAVMDLAFGPDGLQLFSAGQDKEVLVWNVDQRKALQRLSGHRSALSALAVQGDLLASASDGGILLWQRGRDAARNWSLLPEFSNGSAGANSLAFSPDGSTLASGSRTGDVRLFVVKPDALVAEASKRHVRPWSIDECAKFGFVGWLRPKCPRDMEDEIVADAAKAVDDGQYDKAMERLRGANLTEVQAQTQVLVQLEAVLMKGAVDWAEGTAADAEHSRADLLNLEAVFRRFEEAKLLSFDATKRLTELKAYRRARLALDLVQEGHMREATAALEEASRLDPATYSKPAPGVAHLLAVRGLERAADSAALSAQERTEASAWLDAALQFNDDMPMIHWGMGLLDDTPEVRLARLHLPRAGLLLQSAEPSMNLAVVLGQARQPREAAKWAEQAQIAEPQSDDAWFLLGQAWAAAEEWTKAIRALDRVSPQSEIYADAATSAAALAFERLGQPEEAMRRLGLSLQYKPEDLSLLVSYAETLYANGKTEKSKQIAARALKRPDNGDAMQSKAKTAALFILFATSYAEGRIDDAQLALWQIARRVKNQRQIKLDDDWMFNGVRAAVKKGWDQASANDIAKVLNVLDFVESNGQKGSTDQMASVLQARSAK